jgi:hypothetical protein
MRRVLAGALLGVFLALPVAARNFAVPAKDPSITLTVPDAWKVQAIDYGYSAMAPGQEVFFAVEYVHARDIEAMLDANEQWMKENKIRKAQPERVDGQLNGIEATIFQFNTTDETGPTVVEFILLPGGRQRVIMLTLWASEKERAKHAAAIDSIMNSIKPVN